LRNQLSIFWLRNFVMETRKEILIIMNNVLIGCGQITWMRGAPEEQVLAEIAQAGYDGAPAGPREGRSAEETVALYKEYGLKPAPGYLGADFWRADKAEEILNRATSLARFMKQVGCTEVYVAASGFDHVTSRGLTRRDTAGHVKPEDALSEAEYRQFAKALNQVGEATLKEGVRSCFHNHVGTPIETRAEIDKLFSLVDRSVVFMGPDTGHLAWGGVDVVEFCRDYAGSIKTMHLKDINPQVMAEGREKEWSYFTFSEHGVFAELGEGFIDFPAVLEILKGENFEGWLITETDVTMKATPLESVTISRNYLKSLGL
jgi:inosose dehydratase